MPQFISSYRSAKAYDATADADGPAAWGASINEVIAPSVVDPGWPVFGPAAVLGGTGQSTQLGRPTITRGGVEAGALAPCPPGTRPGESGRGCSRH